jgi:tetratricopeptide (TPR) repeat protein
MVQMPAKWLVLLVGLGFLIGECSRAFAQNDDPGVLAQQIARLYQEGKYREAIPIAERLLSINKRVLGPEHPDTATSLNNLAGLYDEMGYYAKAESLFQQALHIWKKIGGPEHPYTAISLNNLALLYCHMGAYAKAEPFYQQALQIRKKVLGPEHPATATSLNNLALLYWEMGEYAKAELLYQQALQIKKKVLGLEHPDTATSLNNLAGLYDVMGDYAKAEPLLQEGLRIRQKVLGEEHPYTAESLNNLAGLYDDMGDYAKAEPFYQQALQIRKKVLGLEHPDTATSLNNLALLYWEMGEYAKAELLYQQALQIKKKVLGLEHPDTATGLNNLGGLYDVMRDYAKAEPLLQEALRIRQKVLGEEHPDTAESLNNLADVYRRTGDYAKAEPLFQRALRIARKTLGPEHPATATSLNNLAFLKFDLGQIREARALAQLAAKAQLGVLSQLLSFTSEEQRLAYEGTIDPYSLFTVLKESEADLASAVLRYKGVVLDSIIEDHLVAEAGKESDHRDLVWQLAADKRQLGQLLLRAPKKPSSETNQKIEELEREVEQIEGTLAQHVSGLGRARRALNVTVEQVQAAISKDGALIEYLRYGHYLGKGAFERRYGAIVLVSTGPPHWLPLSTARDVDTAVARYQHSILDASDQGELSANLEELYRELWAPIEQSLSPDVKRVIISPDSQLNFVSFATLLDSKERFLAEKYIVQYAASGRDLLRDVKPAISTAAVVFANPDFTLSSSQTIATADDKSSNTTPGTMRGTEKKDVEDLIFGPLEGTQKECDKLTKAFEAWHWKADSFTGKDATKEALLQIHSPFILHLATHGFFEAADRSDTRSPEQEPVGFERSVAKAKFFKNPMHRSGLALAGAQTTLEAWKRGEAPPVENDGIVTAEDVAALDLKGTWLVTLSACDTGSGEAKAGEGVMGLRRGFTQAGTQNLLMTLWPISDETTVQIMTDFYNSARKIANAPQALADVQRDWLLNTRKEHGLAQAVRLAGPFIMSSQGKP